MDLRNNLTEMILSAVLATGIASCGRSKVDTAQQQEPLTVPECYPASRVLTISATEYASITGKNLRSYHASGVHVGPGRIELEHFLCRVPKNAEVVVGFKHSQSGDGFNAGHDTYFSGTSLINID